MAKCDHPARRRRTAARIAEKWGLDVPTWRALRADGTIRAFERQRQTARDRGIAFRLTFAQWYSIWLQSGKLSLRGRGADRFCMARFGDTGAYEIGNVFIQSNSSNGREAVEKWRGKAKANRGVFCLYPGRPKPWLAKAGRQRLGYFATEQEAVDARAAHLATRT